MMKSEPEELIESMFRINSDIKFDNLKDESLDIDLSACAVIPLERSSGAALLDLYLANDESIDYGLTDLRAHSPVPQFTMPAIPQVQHVNAASTTTPPPPQPFRDVESSKKNKRKLSQPKRADSHVSDDDDTAEATLLSSSGTELLHAIQHESDSFMFELQMFVDSKPTGATFIDHNDDTATTSTVGNNSDGITINASSTADHSDATVSTADTRNNTDAITITTTNASSVSAIASTTEQIDSMPMPKPKIVYLCHNCNTCYISRVHFEQHYRETYQRNPMYTCQICKKQMSNMRSFRGHYYRHITTAKFECTVCPKKFISLSLLNQHNDLMHTVGNVHKCTMCEATFTEYVAYRRHMREHRAKQKVKPLDTLAASKWKCPECDKLLMNRSSLSMHMKIHRPERQYECLECPQKFVQKINLANHLKIHSGEKPYSCTDCDKSFVGRSQLIRHQTYHRNERAFKCETCSKMYKTERDLKLHQMVHSDQRPHACTHCGKTFLSSSKLKQHYNIHTGARPFKCKYCDKDFTNFPNWLKHIRRRHKVDHKTGEQLAEMPTFLTRKIDSGPVVGDGKTATTTTKKSTVKPMKKICDKSKVTKERKKRGEHGAAAAVGKVVSATKKVTKVKRTTVVRVSEDASDGHTPMGDGGEQQCSVQIENDNLLNVFRMPPDDMSLLKLDTSDDLERATSIIMQQALDMEDDHNANSFVVKHEQMATVGYTVTGDSSRSLDIYTLNGDDSDLLHSATLSYTTTTSALSSALHADDESLTAHSEASSTLTTMLPPNLFTTFQSSQQQQQQQSDQQQCDVSSVMLPLPPITTMKNKRNLIEHFTQLFPTNVL